MSMNLHNIVRGAINANLADVTLTYYRSLGEREVDYMMQNAYAAPVSVKGSFQSEGDAALDHANLAGQNSITRKLYLYSSDSVTERPWGIYRPLARTGDYFLDANGAYWLVVAVEEDFSAAGWECLRVQMQDNDPELKVVEDESEGGDDGDDSESESA